MVGQYWRKRIALLMLVAAAPALLGATGMRANFDQRILAAHNRERAALGIAPLSWDATLADHARSWAAHLSRSGRFEHSPDEPGVEPEGENIWGGTPRHYLPEHMVALWAAEKRHFRPGIFPANSRTGDVEDVGHYTQLMWRDSGTVGCGLAAIGKEEILVCRYRKAGNVTGQVPF